MLDDDFTPDIVASLKIELQLFDGKCYYDETRHRIVYHSLQDAMEAYNKIQALEMDKFKWLESERVHHDAGPSAIMAWVTQYSTQFREYWRKTHICH